MTGGELLISVFVLLLLIKVSNAQDRRHRRRRMEDEIYKTWRKTNDR